MKLSRLFAFTLPFLIAPSYAQNAPITEGVSTFHFSTEVSRVVEKDVMQAEVYSRQEGKNLSDLKKTISSRLNTVLTITKKSPEIEVKADGVRHYANYDNKGKVNGWVAEGRIQMKSKNMEAIAQVLDNLDPNIAIGHIQFSVSPETLVALEDEMTLDIVKQFQHKAELIQKSLNAQSYTLSNVELRTPNGRNVTPEFAPRMMLMNAKSASDELPLEADTQTISASASGKVIFKLK